MCAGYRKKNTGPGARPERKDVYMLSENLSAAKILSVLAWVVLGLGVAGIGVIFVLTPAFSAQMIAALLLGLFGVAAVSLTLQALARVLKTVTYLYQLTWEQFKEMGDDIDQLDGSFDGSDGPQCPYCGALVHSGEEKCRQCGKKLPAEVQNKDVTD